MTLRCTFKVYLLLLLTALFTLIFFNVKTDAEIIPETIVEQRVQEEEKAEEIVVEPIEEESYPMSEEDMNLISLVTMAEAEGESELGKRLVIDTILNRIDHPNWPNSGREVIYQKSQFTSVWNGRIERCYVRDDILNLVKEELKSRTNTSCLFFRTEKYSSYGTPLLKEGNHYFSSY